MTTESAAPTQTITFSQEGFGAHRKVFADQWPQRIKITGALIRVSDPRYLRRHGRRLLTITVDNGWALYERPLFSRVVNDVFPYRLVRAFMADEDGSA